MGNVLGVSVKNAILNFCCVVADDFQDNSNHFFYCVIAVGFYDRQDD